VRRVIGMVEVVKSEVKRREERFRRLENSGRLRSPLRTLSTGESSTFDGR
jgi:hypothetical protein